MKKPTFSAKSKAYYVQGMHCPACEIFIEKKLLQCQGIVYADASVKDGKVVLKSEDTYPDLEQLNNLFQDDGYRFSERSFENEKKNRLLTLGFAIMVIVAFLLLERTGFTQFVSVDSTSSLITFFLFGLIAGVSSCAALVGGLVLSLAKQWNDLYSHRDTPLKKMEPHFLFNVGRLLAFAGGGGVLGLIGRQFSLSLRFSSILVIMVSVLMAMLGLQMLGVKRLQGFRVTLPRFMTRYLVDESRFRGRYMPLVMGALTFFLPCGFTITVQGLALLSGSFLQGSLLLFCFALGTLPPLLSIGISSLRFLEKPRYANTFLKIAGMVVIFFVLFNVNSQLNVMGLPSLDDLVLNPTAVSGKSNANLAMTVEPMIEGTQLIKMEASARGYIPNSFTVKKGIPVRWEVTDVGTSGCTNAIIAKDFFPKQIGLSHGKTSVMEFTPQVAGKFKFSCWMGMITGSIEVVN